ncbi:MAG: ATP-binding cassette domain-containing protein [Planctomycetota bacterium]|jgi:ATPase subunit of ABC transporter with duplicated ATPase domains
MARGGVDFQNVSFAYEGSSGPLFEGMTCHFPTGWTGIVGANGAGKTTILKLVSGLLRPQGGKIFSPEGAAYIEQRTDEAPLLLETLIGDAGGEAGRIRGRLGIEEDWADRWASLSHGERKRAQTGVILWKNPAVLAVDEPTNHLDREARDQLEAALRAYRGIGLLVSHDRELLDALCGQCLFVDPPGAVMRPGGITKALEEESRETLSLRKRAAQAKAAKKKLEREAVKRRAEASRADRLRSKRGLGPRDSDAREKIDRARVSGKDGVAGRRLRQLEGRLRQARERHEGMEIRKEHRLGIWMPGALAKRDFLFRLASDSLSLGGERRLAHPDLWMGPKDRVALTGPNGGGKSTLIGRILGTLTLEEERVTVVPQEIDLADSQRILSSARRLPHKTLGRMMSVVSQLGSRPERLLESEAPSPGEVRKILLAMGIARVPHLIVMDEPTNHMDLPSIRALEEALEGCPCGLLLVSHDRRFLGRLTETRWQVTRVRGEPGRFSLRVRPGG